MSLRSLPIFQNRSSTCEEELNCLVYEIDSGFKKCKEDARVEITVLKNALSDYKNKYDSCRTKLKDLIKKHEDLKVQFVSLDNGYQRQLAELQEEVTVLKSSFQNWWMEENRHKKAVSADVRQDVPGGNALDAISDLKEQVNHWSERAKELSKEKEQQGHELEHMEAALRDLKQQLSICRQEAASRETDLMSMSHSLERLAEQAQKKFLKEEALHQQAFTSSLDAKVQRFKDHLAASSTYT